LGRPGAVEGPRAFRRTLARLPVHYNKEPFYLIDCGDVICEDGHLEESQQALGDIICMMLEKDVFPIVIGGGHEVAWGHYQGLMKFDQSPLTLFNIDSHFDTREIKDQKGNSGTSFRQIHQTKNELDYYCLGIQETGNTDALFDFANQHKINFLSVDIVHQRGHEAVLEFINPLLFKPRLMATICLDVFASPFAPGVSAPQPFGLLPHHIVPAIEALAGAKNLTSLEIAELSPPHDPQGVTALLAASLIARFLYKV
jgi:formiminoglutamase